MIDTEEQQRFESFKLGWTSNDVPPPAAKRNSHHRRRSSVSTRHESAEMMGVTMPESQPEDADKDSIRRRALWALEGKPEKVEIPELSTPDSEKKPWFDFPTRPSFPPGSGFTMPAKRDSFKMPPSKDMLGTLHEEEEEEEENLKSPVSAPAAHPATRTRPAQLNLRPLSLTPESLSNGLPTPLLTPNRQGLKSLSLLNDNDSSICQRRPANLLITSESHSSCNSSPVSSDDGRKPLRRSSISYKPANTGLPTPEMTPTSSENRYSGSSRGSMSSNSDIESLDLSRESRSGAGTLTASEQHFLFKSHNALLARITDLEKSLTLRRKDSFFGSDGTHSRPLSMASDASSEPSDEMLRLVSDLKAERDELKRDVDGWRTRVGDLEKQIGVFAKRVETERREAWVARSRLGFVEVEKASFLKELEESRSRVDELTKIIDTVERVNELLRTENEQLKSQNDHLTQCNGDLEQQLKDRLAQEADELATPVASQHGFESRRRGYYHSMDSFGSTTDVEFDIPAQFGFPLKAVEEEAENDDPMLEDDNGLAGYEDEEEEDLEMQSRGSNSSFGSDSEFPRSSVVAQCFKPAASMISELPIAHKRTASLSKTWTFPRNANAGLSKSESTDDKFFGCLDDTDSDTTSSADFLEEYEQSKEAWTDAFKNASVEDDFNPFILATHVVGTVISEAAPVVPSSGGLLSVVIEEEEEEDSEETDVDEDEEVFNGELGGIKITFTPPQAEDEMSLQDGLTHYLCSPPEAKSLSSEDNAISMVTPPRSVPRASAIPRPASLMKHPSPPSSSLPKLSSPKFGVSASPTNMSTPPAKRPSFIPQPITPPSPIRTSKGVTPKPTFIRQPQRKILNNSNFVLNPPASGSHLDDLTCKTQPLSTHLPQALPFRRRTTLQK